MSIDLYVCCHSLCTCILLFCKVFVVFKIWKKSQKLKVIYQKRDACFTKLYKHKLNNRMYIWISDFNLQTFLPSQIPVSWTEWSEYVGLHRVCPPRLQPVQTDRTGGCPPSVPVPHEPPDPCTGLIGQGGQWQNRSGENGFDRQYLSLAVLY